MATAADSLRRLVLAFEQLRPRYGALAGVGETDLMALGNLVTVGPMGAAELARRLGITRSSVTALVDRLEAAELVIRLDDPTDRRRLRLVVTDRGRSALLQARSLSVQALHSIEPERMAAVARALDDVAAALDHQAKS